MTNEETSRPEETLKTSFLRRLWRAIEALFPDKSLARMLLQLALVALLGGVVADSWSRSRGRGEQRAERYRQKMIEAKEFIDEFARAFGRRVFLMQLVYWELFLHNETSEYRQELLRRKYEDYYLQLIEWNTLNPYHTSSLGYHFPEYLESEFEDVVDILRAAQPEPGVDGEQTVKLNVTESQFELAQRLVQEKFRLLHAHLKAGTDKRLENQTTLSKEEIEEMRAAYREMMDSIYAYPELLYELLSNARTAPPK